MSQTRDNDDSLQIGLIKIDLQQIVVITASEIHL